MNNKVLGDHTIMKAETPKIQKNTKTSRKCKIFNFHPSIHPFSSKTISISLKIPFFYGSVSLLGPAPIC